MSISYRKEIKANSYSLLDQVFLNERLEKPNESSYFPYKHHNVRSTYTGIKRYMSYVFMYGEIPRIKY